ncbi:hypothetical protein [Microcoleus sp. T2B6]|uniref:hypothetical protein n=1 Tax=Microcoleus sp. T2B6 TaxID=3055424 RepID=UPI002FD7094E
MPQFDERQKFIASFHSFGCHGFEEALNHYEALFAAVAASHSEKILEPLPK